MPISPPSHASAGPVRSLVRVLMRWAVCIMVREWGSSQWCPHCHSRLQAHYGKLRSKATGHLERLLLQ